MPLIPFTSRADMNFVSAKHPINQGPKVRLGVSLENFGETRAINGWVERFQIRAEEDDPVFTTQSGQHRVECRFRVFDKTSIVVTPVTINTGIANREGPFLI